MPFYEFHLNCFLNQDIPLEIKQTLMYMTLDEKINKPDYINYAKYNLFQHKNWETFLNKGIPHFPFLSNSNVLFSKTYGNTLTINCSFMSKDDIIIKDFLDWIEPHIANNNDYLGYYREFQKHLNLLFLENEKIKSWKYDTIS
jgi:hypothetical protein